MINIDGGNAIVKGTMIEIESELAATIVSCNDRYNSMPGVEKDIFIKILIECIQHLMLGGDKGA